MNHEDLRDLPGAELVLDGIKELQQGLETNMSLLVAIGTTRLRSAGLRVPDRPDMSELPEHQLYRRLSKQYGNEAHSRYNAMVRRLISFERALEVRNSVRRDTSQSLSR